MCERHRAREKDPIQCARDMYPIAFVFVFELMCTRQTVREAETATACM